ncbi:MULTISPECIES: response regulator [Streptomyces]|uniref:DNA-binding response regulator n=1 Tax=Streptomyces lasiicapitis TaxID=1923961 RepID=A0ABQ2MF23_9ACTN|nr:MULTISPECIES: response regulator transcription factor [Streptomyces]QIB46951.1 response regulator transcription factor [Streptomyces aureoverticillatus]GGO50930.1 DNA-binding response regulator [Streptomyces lasiicapitis]
MTTHAESPELAELTVVIADDHPVVRGGLRALLGSIDGITVVGEAAGGRDAVRETLLHRPRVLVVDLEMPDLDGVSATREVVAAAPETAVLVLTMFEDDESVFAAMRAGARGFILKGAGQDEIVRAVRCVAAGEAIFGPRIARRVAEWMSRPADAAASSPFPELTVRELEVLDLIAAGMANPAIARTLRLAPKTISNHVSAIFMKLRVADRATAIVRARDAGLGRRS